MDRAASVEGIRTEAERILTLVEPVGARLDAPVPACPEWSVEQTVNHLGRVYAMVSEVLRGNPEDPPDRSLIPKRADSQPAPAWLRERLEIMLALLGDVPDGSLAWNFVSGPSSPVAFWWRRQLHETLIHRVDVEQAVGIPVTKAEPAVAADGIDEFLTMSGFRPVGWDEIELGEGMTIHLHATDVAEAEWTLDTDQKVYSKAHLKADVALRGEAWAIDRWCWRRLTLGASQGSEETGTIEAFGDVAAAEEWRPAI